MKKFFCFLSLCGMVLFSGTAFSRERVFKKEWEKTKTTFYELVQDGFKIVGFVSYPHSGRESDQTDIYILQKGKFVYKCLDIKDFDEKYFYPKKIRDFQVCRKLIKSYVYERQPIKKKDKKKKNPVFD